MFVCLSETLIRFVVINNRPVLISLAKIESIEIRSKARDKYMG